MSFGVPAYDAFDHFLLSEQYNKIMILTVDEGKAVYKALTSHDLPPSFFNFQEFWYFLKSDQSLNYKKETVDRFILTLTQNKKPVICVVDSSSPLGKLLLAVGTEQK